VAWQYNLQAKRFDLLVYKGMYNDFYDFNDESNVYQSTWFHEEPIEDNDLLEYVSFVLNLIEDGNQVDSCASSTVAE
jgi:hypothetical protein